MWCGVVSCVVSPEQQDVYATQYGEFVVLRAQQPGKLGDMDIDLDDRRTINLVLWESRAAHDAVHPRLLPEYNRLVRPLLDGTTTFLGAGDVTEDSLSTAVLPADRHVHAFVNEAVIAPDQRAAYEEQHRELSAARARQPGFCGAIEFDAGEGRMVWVAVWESHEALQAARDALRSVIDRVHVPVSSRAALGSGIVVRNTISG